MTRVNPERNKRKETIEPGEFNGMLEKTDEEDYSSKDYYRARDKAIACVFYRTGKRRGEVARLEVSDLKIKNKNLSITFTVLKKRTSGEIPNRREKLIPLSDPWVNPIIEYWKWMNENHPECKFMFPTTHYSPLANTLTIKSDSHLTGRQVLRRIQKMNPDAWCHLFRETMGANVVRAKPDALAPFRVKRRLDLEDIRTAFRYFERYAADVIETEVGDQV